MKKIMKKNNNVIIFLFKLYDNRKIVSFQNK